MDPGAVEEEKETIEGGRGEEEQVDRKLRRGAGESAKTKYYKNDIVKQTCCFLS